jgi:hypothetical protein
VAPDQFLRDGRNDVAECEGAGLLGHAGVENHLQQEIAEFVAQVGEVLALNGVGHLVGFLDRIG